MSYSYSVRAACAQDRPHIRPNIKPSLKPNVRQRIKRALAFSLFWLLAFVALLAPGSLSAQGSGRSKSDTTRAHKGSIADTVARKIEGVLVEAIRAGSDAPIAQTTISGTAITARNFGQDVPMLLMKAAPSMTAHTETGTQWGYSYLRLRGLDQTRINITVDGVPLNDPEDQVLYFANMADLLSSVHSVQVQRGVGTSTAGTASYAGSINFETSPIARKDRRGSAEMQIGSFGAQRASASFNTGLTSSRFAVYGRASALRTNGYREHSGVMGRSAFLGAGWFGNRNIVKLTTIVGQLADTLSYTGATLTELANNRRYNPLNEGERDKFGQQMVSIAYTHARNDGGTFSTTVYRNSASGNYDYFELPDRYRYNLAHTWYGVTSAMNVERGNLKINAGANANTYQRAHRAYFQPDEMLYSNTGHKQDASVFTKLSLETGRMRWFADLQGRWARFNYEPSSNAGISSRSIDWLFFNPKGGVTFSFASGVSAFASVGRTSREPARSDLFAGEDDLNAGNVADFGDFSRIKPERLRDTELGLSLRKGAFDMTANVYRMDFRNDLARIGAPTASGSIPRRNVGSSYRQGVELDAAYTGIRNVVLGGSATVSDNRIRQFTDSSRGAPVTRFNVDPMLTPRFLTTHRIEIQASSQVSVGVEGRYQSRSYLDNTGSSDRVLPDFYTVDASIHTSIRRVNLALRGANLGNTQKFGSGEVSSSGKVRYFVLSPRSVFLTAAVSF